LIEKSSPIKDHSSEPVMVKDR